MAERSNSDSLPDGSPVAWPRPVQDGSWTDFAGVTWRIRGGMLDRKGFRRLTKRDDLLVLHVYGVAPRLLEGTERSSLLGSIDEFFAGRAPENISFDLGDFRNDAHEAMLVVQEYC